MTKVLDGIDKANNFLDDCRRKGQQHRIHYSELASISLLIGINEKLEKLVSLIGTDVDKLVEKRPRNIPPKKNPKKLGPPLC